MLIVVSHRLWQASQCLHGHLPAVLHSGHSIRIEEYGQLRHDFWLADDDSGDMLAGFEEIDNLKTINTFFYRKASEEWTMEKFEYWN